MNNAIATIRTSPLWSEIRDTLTPRAGSTEGVLPPLMILLTIVTGIVDAVAYLKLGHVFVANMTGNVVFLGFAAAGASGLSSQGRSSHSPASSPAASPQADSPAASVTTGSTNSAPPARCNSSSARLRSRSLHSAATTTAPPTATRSSHSSHWRWGPERHRPPARRRRPHYHRPHPDTDRYRRRLMARRRLRSEDRTTSPRSRGDAARCNPRRPASSPDRPSSAAHLATSLLAVVCGAAHDRSVKQDPTTLMLTPEPPT